LVFLNLFIEEVVMGTVIYIKRKRKLTDMTTTKEIVKNNILPFPVMERKAKICESCGLPFHEDVCPDCGPIKERGD